MIAPRQNVAISNKRIFIESSDIGILSRENSLKSSSSSSSSSSLWRWRTASGLPRFQPLAVNNARTESVARSLHVCVHVAVPRRLIKQQLHTVDTQCLRLRPTYPYTRLYTYTRVHRAERRNVLTDRRKLGTAVLCVLRVYTFRYA